MKRIHPRATFTVALLLLSFCSWSAQAPPLLLAKRWEAGADPAGWWMSEKYDGVRGYWDGTHMLTRQGESLAIPDALRKTLPDFPLDGELWVGRGRFQETLAIISDAAPGPGWSAIHYMVFDAPAYPGPFEARTAFVDVWLREHPSPWVRSVEQVHCTGTAHLKSFLVDVESQDGEGVMLRAPGSLYEAGRSDTLRKVKSFDDSDAVVRGYHPGRGKYAGLVGSLLVELPDGTRFSVGAGLSDAERRRPPPIGSVVTIKHHGWTRSGKPRFPVFWRLRTPSPGDGPVVFPQTRDIEPSTRH